MGSPCFADVLADALRAGAGEAPTSPRTAAPPATSSFAASPPYPFLFGATPALARTDAVFAFDAVAKTFPAPPRPVRALTADQPQALDALNTLGAQLTSGFTAQELRRAYRWLAQRVHPDRQHDYGEGERARRARLFIAATAHYRHLLALVDTR